MVLLTNPVGWDAVGLERSKLSESALTVISVGSQLVLMWTSFQASGNLTTQRCEGVPMDYVREFELAVDLYVLRVREMDPDNAFDKGLFK